MHFPTPDNPSPAKNISAGRFEGHQITPYDRPMIELDAVSVATTDAQLLAPTSLRVPAGRSIVLRGDNGAGKTTLLRLLAGRTKPTTGSALLGGTPIDERSPVFRRHTAAMIGLPPMAPDLTLFEHLALVSATWQPPSKRTKHTKRITHADHASHTAETMLSELGLTALGSRFPGELSSGQTQLFGLALVLVRPFEVLLLDEPEQRLDPDRIDVLANALLARRKAGVTLVTATHSARLAERISDQTITLEAAV